MLLIKWVSRFPDHPLGNFQSYGRLLYMVADLPQVFLAVAGWLFYYDTSKIYATRQASLSEYTPEAFGSHGEILDGRAAYVDCLDQSVSFRYTSTDLIRIYSEIPIQGILKRLSRDDISACGASHTTHSLTNKYPLYGMLPW